MKVSYQVNMTCHSCEVLIGESVKEIKGVSSVKADHTKGTVIVDFSSPASGDAIRKAIEKEGYKVS